MKKARGYEPNKSKKDAKIQANSLNSNFVEVVGVNFRTAGTIYYYLTNGLKLKLASKVVVDAPKGEMLATVVVSPVYIPKKNAEFYDPISRTYDKELTISKFSGGSVDGTIDQSAKTIRNLTPIKRVATKQDLERHKTNQQKVQKMNQTVKTLIKKNKLDMKLVTCELTLDARKLSVYYTSENRVNFKPLIEDLLKHYKNIRIELRQIDIKNETKILGALGPCGQELCCARFNITPPQVSIKNLKEQNVSLNPAKINGLCGKLRCCYTYELDVYRDIKQNLPKIDKYLRIKDPDGNVVPAKTIRINILPRTITVVNETGTLFTVPVDNIVETRNSAYWEE